ncbi:MAG: 2,3-bisphosphoglycerate-independent phosphoglycerate mutase [archaeon]
MKKILLVILDGVGDRPSPVLGNKTPLEAAKTPNMDILAKNSACGLMNSVGKGVIPESDNAHLSIFGYPLDKYYTGRGPLEAAGLEMKMKPEDVAFRVNFATVDSSGLITDRRAGRIKSVKLFVEKLNGIEIDGIRFILKAGTSHRACLIMRGKGLCSNISSNDPHKTAVKPFEIKAENKDKEAIFTATILNKFLIMASKILDESSLNKKREKEGKPKANYLLLRGAGTYKKIPSFKERYGLRACCIAGGGLYKGVAKSVGMKVLNVKGATGTLETDLGAKINAAIKALKKYDFVFAHIKGADILGHDGKCIEKKKFIEKIDNSFKKIINLKNTVIAITGDHSTPCTLKDHSADPTPLLIFGGIKDKVNHFSERDCLNGSIGMILGLDLMPKLLKIAKD